MANTALEKDSRGELTYSKDGVAKEQLQKGNLKMALTQDRDKKGGYPNADRKLGRGKTKRPKNLYRK